MATDFQVASEADLNAALLQIDTSPATNTAYTITLTASFALSSDLTAINLGSTDSLTIDGGGATVDGANAYRGLFVYSGIITINDLTIADTVARGGDGSGGGAGLGGGLFVAASGNVTLNNVSFTADSAIGGNAVAGAVGGGGLGGNGGAFGGGGGIGTGASGGGANGAGGAGILPGPLASAGGSSTGGAGGANGGGGGGGAGTTGFISGAGGGYGGGAGNAAGTGTSASGGFGGFGGGGGVGANGSHIGYGGDGGFGGGGGYGGYGGGNGGFGGGAGGGGALGGRAGFGGGGATTASGTTPALGGGGLGAGGAIFVQEGGSLSFGAGYIGKGSVTGGTGGASNNGGSAFGGGIFIQGNQSITFDPASGQTLTINDVIADENGIGTGRVVVNGAGTVVLANSNTFIGGITLDAGTLDLATQTAAGTGLITFAAGSTATLKLEPGAASPTNTIVGFLPGETIDVVGIDPKGMDASLSATLGANNVLTVSGASTVVQHLQLDPSQSYVGYTIAIAPDNQGGGNVTVVASRAAVVTGTVAGQTTSDLHGIRALSGVQIIDRNSNPTESVTITLTNANGVATDANGILSGAGLTHTGAGQYTLTAGSPAAIDAALHALVFAPTTAEAPVGQTVTTHLQISDTNANNAVATDQTTSIVVTAASSVFTVTNETELNAALAQIATTGAKSAGPIAFTINFANDITLSPSVDLNAINIDSGDTLTINGNGHSLNGGGLERGFFDYAGAVAINNLSIINTVATGGAGQGGGGGAGLGGGLFVASGGHVTLTNVTFSGDRAVGGGGGYGNASGGGGGLGGSGGATVGSGGGGIGLLASGGTLTYAGGAGIVVGASAGAAGGAGAGGAYGGGGAGGGGSGPGGGGGVGASGGNGGFGGGGGGGNGGFGGGGGFGYNGGFGGGGGGILAGATSGGQAGFGGGAGRATGGGGGAGGGGLGAGGGIFVQQGGSLSFGTGGVSGDSVAGGYSKLAASGSAFGSGLFIQGNQQIELNPAAGQTLTIADTIADQTGSGGSGLGRLLIDGAGTVVLSGANTFAGGATLQSGTLDIANATALGSSTLTFAPGAAATLVIGNGDLPVYTPSGGSPTPNDISGFGTSDTIDLAGIGVATTAIYDTTTNILTVSGGTARTTSLRVDLAGGMSGAVFTAVSDGNGGTSLSVTCFVAGTRIATPHGEVAVESLRPGDLVLAVDGDAPEAVAVRWIGRRRIDLRRHDDRGRVAPIRIRTGAFGDGRPCRDLLLSPDHAIFAGGVLIPAKRLVNHSTITQEPGGEHVTYYHVELDRHRLVLAEGLATESYLDTGNRALFENAGTVMMLHPDFAVNASLRCWETDSCAPLALSEERIKRVWRRLADRATALGYASEAVGVATDPALRLSVAGRIIVPVQMSTTHAVFALPRGGDAAVLLSRAAAPSATRPWLNDDRKLGVSIAGIRFIGAPCTHDLPIDDPSLASGWWPLEHVGADRWRWTNGAATLPLPPDADVLELRLAGTAHYPMAEIGEPTVAAVSRRRAMSAAVPMRRAG